MSLEPARQAYDYSLDDLYMMVSAIYAEQNAHRSPSATFAHFVEVCGMLTIHDRKKKREGVTVEDALCKALGWFFPLLSKFRVGSIERLVFRKYPYACPYCRHCPHKEGICKTTRGTDQTANAAAVHAMHAQNSSKCPRRLNAWQQMFDEIYPRDTNTLGTGRSTIGLLEELGELAEAVRVFEKHPKYFAGEAADVFSYLMGIANEHRLKQQVDGLPAFDFEVEFLRRYPGLCIQCGYEVCICPSVPESTIGRLAKELDIAPSENVFSLDPSASDAQGRRVAASVLQELGGLPAIGKQLPLDRGETNRAVILLCLRLSDEIRPRDARLAVELNDAAIKIAADARDPGSRSHAEASALVLSVLATVWPKLRLAVIPEDGSLPSRLGRFLRAQTARIGVITALPKEFAAMRRMLEEERFNPVAGDPNEYVVGTIPSIHGDGTHLIVVTLLKELGNNSAAAAATHLLRSFPKIEDILMVGIAGGIPRLDSAQEHVRLGDIVVCDKEGVIQYDNLKVEIGTVKVRSSASKPSARLVGAMKLLESERLMKKYPWEDFAKLALDLEDAGRPADHEDVIHNWETGTATPVAHPTDSNRRNGQPKVHYGRIGAANVLLKNPQLRDQLGREHSIKAIEMEGSGIADAAWQAGQQYIVIRGICDYCDPTKTDKWQAYAAVVAAAYARALISAISLPSEPTNLGG